MSSSGLPSLLKGVRILDCTRNIAGPVATMLAAEMGADVIKVEPPSGDEMRQWPPFVDGQSVYFVSCNRGKRSIALDLKTDDGQRTFRKLLGWADVLVENYRPGTLEKLGLGWSSIKTLHPRMVWVSVSGYGRSGPRAQDPAYDSMIQAFSGMMGITGEKNRPPVRSGGSPIDVATAYLAWGSIIAGVRQAEATGQGSLLEVSLMETALGFMHAYLQGEMAGLSLPVRMGSETMGIYPLGAFEVKGGRYCFLQVSNELQWSRFCNAIGASELLADERFANNPARVKNRDSLRPLIQAYLQERDAAEWEELLSAVGVPASSVRSLADVVADKQVVARGMVKPVVLPSGETISTWGVPIKMNEAQNLTALKVPAFDEHRDDIMSELELRSNGGGI